MSYGYPGLSWLLADLIGASRAKDVLFTGAVVGGQEGADLGLFNRVVPDAEVREAALGLAAGVAALPPGGVREAKRLMREGGGRDQRGRYDAENAAIRAALGGTSAADLFAGFKAGPAGGGSPARDQ
jgi:enoyl-CoA hydratase/carnithine racemase